MCGICGWIGRTRSDAPVALPAMLQSLRSRGPDDCGTWCAPGGLAALGHTRLSIIDLERSAQPMTNEDGSVVVTYNGEIYNFVELRRMLVERGHAFRTRGDTEVLVHLYEEHGARMAEHLDGMFAFAVYDARRHALLLARDRAGIKPLHYWHDAALGELLFGSQLAALLANPVVPRRLDRRVLAQYLHFGYAVHPATWLEGVRQLEPGTALVWSDGTVRLERYYEWRYAPRAELGTISRAEPELEQRLSRSVASQLVADVPLGSFLSGGLDSSTVTGLAQREKAAAGDDIHAFTVAFHDPSLAEGPRARAIAREVGARHTEIDAGELAFERSLFERLLREMGEPFGDISALSVFLLCSVAREHVKVALSGDGGDELFLGYAGLRKQRIARRARAIPATLRRALADRLEGARADFPRRVRKYLGLSSFDDPGLIIEWSRRWDPSLLATLLDAGAIAELFPRPDALFPEVRERIGGGETGGFLEQQMRFHVLVDLPCDCLLKVDRMSMAHGLEVRVPMLSNAMLDFGGAVPLALGARAPRTKEPLRTLAESLAPTVARPAPKVGFGFPLDAWLRPHLARAWREWEAGRVLSEIGFDPRGLEQVVALYERAGAGGAQSYDTHLLAARLYDLLLLALWMDTFDVRG